MSTPTIRISVQQPVIRVTPSVASPIRVSVLPSPTVRVSLAVATPIRVSVSVAQPIRISLPATAFAAGVTSTINSLRLSWAQLVMKWSEDNLTAPVGGGGSVRNYFGDGGTTYYRFIPDPYDPELDTFYADYAAGVLSSPIASRYSP